MLLNFNHNTKNTIHPSQSDMNGDYINIDSLILLILSLLCSSKLWNVAVGHNTVHLIAVLLLAF